MIFARCSLVLAVLTCFAPSTVFSDDSNRLFETVWLVQFQLGRGAEAAEIRNRFSLPELQTEAAKGYAADPQVLTDILHRFDASDSPLPDPSFAKIRDELRSFLEQLQASLGQDVVGQIVRFSPDLEAVTQQALEDVRLEALRALENLARYNEVQLSTFGRHVLHERLELAQLIEETQDMDMLSAEPGARPFLVQLNSFRTRILALIDNYALAATEYSNPYTARAELALRALDRRIFNYLLGHSQRLPSFKRLWERQLNAMRGEEGIEVEARTRAFQAELGRWMGMLEERGQQNAFLAAARRQFAKPNLRITVAESVANRLASQPVFRVEEVDDVILGLRIRGWSQTTGSVNLDFVEDPYNAHVRVSLNGSVVADNYTEEGPVTAYSAAHGALQAERSVLVNIGGIQVGDSRAAAGLSSEFRGIARMPLAGLIERIAYRQFLKKKNHAEQVASELARDRLLDQFSQQTDEALGSGLAQLDEGRAQGQLLIEEINGFRRDYSEVLAQDESGAVSGPINVIDPLVFPRLAVTSSHEQIIVSGTLDGPNRLAAPDTPPASSVPADVRTQIHESLLSNLAAPLFQGRRYQNWQFGLLVESFTGLAPEGLIAEDDKRWSIQFAEGRPIQFEFDDQEFRVAIFGTQFSRDQQTFNDAIKISIAMRMINDNGDLKLVRVGQAKAEFADPGPKSTEAIAFRTFLQDNLDQAVKGDPMETAVDLPAELVPAQYVDDPEVRKLMAGATLVELSSENGWLTLGWNYHKEGEVFDELVNTPAIHSATE